MVFYRVRIIKFFADPQYKRNNSGILIWTHSNQFNHIRGFSWVQRIKRIECEILNERI